MPTVPTVLVATNAVLFEAHPEWPNLLIRFIAWGANIVFNYAIMEAIVNGRLPNFPLPLDSAAWLCGARPGLRSLKGSVNACGINNYVRVWIRLHISALFGWLSGKTVRRTKSGGVAFAMTNEGGKVTLAADASSEGQDISAEQAIGGGPLQGDPHDPRFEMSDMGWDLCPSSLLIILVFFWRRYKLPIIVTESGTADGEEDGHRRVRYLSGCLRAVHQAIRLGADVRGYLYWSYQDNFEWAEGYTPRFGLCRVDYTTLTRLPTKGFRLYQRVIARHRERQQSAS